MARPKRDETHRLQHITNRGKRREAIFLDDHDRRVFLAIIRAAARKYGFTAHAYCLMGNHYHLIVDFAPGTMSLAMKHISAMYTREFNRRHGFDGSLFRGRYANTPILDAEHLANAVAYVHNNPLEIHDDIAAEEFEWSSCAAHLGHAPAPDFLATRHASAPVTAA